MVALGRVFLTSEVPLYIKRKPGVWTGMTWHQTRERRLKQTPLLFYYSRTATGFGVGSKDTQTFVADVLCSLNLQ